MSRLAELVYKLTADGTAFGREIDKAAKDVDRFNKRATSSLAKVGKAFAAIGVAAAGALAVVVRQSINAADEIGKMSDRLGIATEDLSALAFAAEQNGSSLEAVERGTKALSKSILDASRGAGRAAQTFDRLGISAVDANGQIRGTVDVIRDISDRFSDLQSGAEKSALAQELFGRSGAELIPLLDQGSDGLDDFTRRAEELGLVISEQTAREAAQFNDNLNLVQQSLQGTVRQITADALPTLTAYSERLAASATDSTTLARRTEFVSTALKIVLTTVETVVGVFKLLGETIGALLALIFEFGRSAINVFQAFGRNIKAVAKAFTQALSGDFAGAFGTIKGSLGDTIGVIGDGFKTQIGVMSKAYDEIGGIVASSVKEIGDIWTVEAPVVAAKVEEAVRKTYEPVTKSFATQKEAIDAAAKAAEEYAKRLERNLARTLDLIKTDAERFAEALVEIDELLRAGAINQDQYNLAVAALAERYDDATRAARELAAEGERLTQSLRGPLELYQDSVEQIERLFAAGAISRETYDLAIEQSTRRLAESLEQTGEEVEKLGVTLEGAAGSLFGTLEDALFDPLNASIEDMVVSFVKALGRMAMEAAKAQATRALLGGAAGGAVPGFAGGGYVSGPGTGTSDSILARLSNGEFVIPATRVLQYGVGFLENIRRGRAPGRKNFAEGGLASSGGDMNVTNVNIIDPSLVEDYLMSRKGEKVILNVIRRNKAAIA